MVAVNAGKERLLTITTPSVVSDVLLLNTDADDTEVITLTEAVLFEIGQLELLNFVSRYPIMIDVIISRIDLRIEQQQTVQN